MKRKNIIFIILTVIFAILCYVYIDRGINLKTKKSVNYNVSSDIFYKVNLFDNQSFSDNSLSMGGRYISSLVDNIEFTFNYSKHIDDDINGYYAYNVLGNLILYKDNMNDVVWSKEYVILDNKVNLLDKNNIRNININDTFKFDYDYYKSILNDFMDEYGVNLSGYMELNFIVNEAFEFKNIKNEVVNDEVIKVLIPLNQDTFRISILDNPHSNTDSYYEFSSRERVNYLFLVFGALCFSIMVANLVLVMLGGVKIYKELHKYDKELKEINNKYGDILVKVKRFYNKRKYNLIYVDNFNELMDVYNKVKCPITYREVKKNMETIFLITDGDNAWIYRMINENRVKKGK